MRNRRLDVSRFRGWLVEGRGGTGRSLNTFVAGFTVKREKWLRSDGGARRVPGMPTWCPQVTKWPQARPRCPARISLAQGGWTLAVGNHLFAVASTKNATTRSWNAHGTHAGPWFISVGHQCFGTHLHGHHPCYNVMEGTGQLKLTIMHMSQ